MSVGQPEQVPQAVPQSPGVGGTQLQDPSCARAGRSDGCSARLPSVSADRVGRGRNPRRTGSHRPSRRVQSRHRQHGPAVRWPSLQKPTPAVGNPTTRPQLGPAGQSRRNGPPSEQPAASGRESGVPGPSAGSMGIRADRRIPAHLSRIPARRAHPAHLAAAAHRRSVRCRPDHPPVMSWAGTSIPPSRSDPRRSHAAAIDAAATRVAVMVPFAAVLGGDGPRPRHSRLPPRPAGCNRRRHGLETSRSPARPAPGRRPGEARSNRTARDRSRARPRSRPQFP